MTPSATECLHHGHARATPRPADPFAWSRRNHDVPDSPGALATDHDDLPPVVVDAPVVAPPQRDHAHSPEMDADCPRGREERERRRPHAARVASLLQKMLGSTRTDPRYHHTAVYKVGPEKKGWRPDFTAGRGAAAIEAMVLGGVTGRGRRDGSTWYGLGAYYLDEFDRTDHVTFDLDAHGEATEEQVLVWLHQLERSLRKLRARYLIAVSKSGRGRHVTVWFTERLEGRVAVALGRWVVRDAGLPSNTEVFPKQVNLDDPENRVDGKVSGSQAAIPGCLNFWVATGGGVLCGEDGERLPFDRWAERLEDLDAHRLDAGAVRAFVEASGALAPPRPKYDGPAVAVGPLGLPPLSTAAAVRDFLERHGLEVAHDRGGSGHWTSVMGLRACPNAASHSSGNVDGAAVLFDAATGVAAFKCHHAGCAGYRWRDLLTGLGYQTEARVVDARPTRWSAPAPHDPPSAPLSELTDATALAITTPVRLLEPRETPAAHFIEFVTQSADPWADLPPVPTPPRYDDGLGEVSEATARALEELEPSVVFVDPRFTPKKLGAPERSLLSTVATEQMEYGSKERARALRTGDCCRAKGVRWCPVHQEVHSCPLSCGRTGTCVGCAGRVADARRAYVAEHWPDAGWVVVDAGASVALSDPWTAYQAARRALAVVKHICRRRSIKGRRWFIGVNRIAFAFPRPVDADYVSDALRHAEVAHVCHSVLSPQESADLVHDLTMEPSRVLEALLQTAEGAALVPDFPYLTESHVRRTDAGRTGTQLPWASDEELREEKKEKAREAAVSRGEDPDEWDPTKCSRAHVDPEGRVQKCGQPTQTRVYVDGVEVARGRPGGASWAAHDRAFAVMAAERVHRRETSHLPSS